MCANKVRKTSKGKRRKGKIKFSSSGRIVEKNDKTRVSKPDTTRYPRMAAQMPRSTGVVFKVKMKRK